MVKKMEKFYVGCKESGDIIEEARSFKDAEEIIKKYEQEDKDNNNFSENYYEIINEKREKIYN